HSPTASSARAIWASARALGFSAYARRNSTSASASLRSRRSARARVIRASASDAASGESARAEMQESASNTARQKDAVLEGFMDQSKMGTPLEPRSEGRDEEGAGARGARGRGATARGSTSGAATASALRTLGALGSDADTFEASGGSAAVAAAGAATAET